MHYAWAGNRWAIVRSQTSVVRPLTERTTSHER
jgi:hypothetical protein